MIDEVQVRTVERDGLTFDVADEGPRDGEPVVLLHGFPERATSWRQVAAILNQAGYRTLAMDQRGYSPRARPRRRRDYRLEEIAGDVVALIDAVGGTAHVVGHDFGAAAAWTTALLHPGKVRTLTAVSVPHPGAFLRSMVRSPQGLRSWYMGFFQLPFLPERLASTSAFDGWARQGGMGEDELRRLREEVVDDGAFGTAINWYRAIPFSDLRVSRGRVTVPTTLVWSDGDIYVNRWGIDRSEDFVDAPYRLVVLEGATHWLPTQEPERLAAAILDRVRGG